MTPYWFPVVTLLLGAVGGYLADALRDKRATRREAAAAERADRREWATAQRQRDVARDAFQRETLIELQDWLGKLGRATGASMHHDEMEFRSSGQWGRSLLGEEWNRAHHEALVNVNRLRVRVLDDDVRQVVQEFSSVCVDVLLGSPADMSDDEGRMRAMHAMDRVTALTPGMHELIGERLRQLA
jgi:hypothetical protein